MNSPHPLFYLKGILLAPEPAPERDLDHVRVYKIRGVIQESNTYLTVMCNTPDAKVRFV